MIRNILQKPFIWVVINQGILSLSALGVVVVLSFFLHPESFGGIRFLAAILAIFAFFSLPGMGSVVMQGSTKLTRQGFIHAVWTQIRWGLGATFGGLILFTYYLIQGNSDFALAFLIGSILAPFANLYLMPGQVLAGLKQFKAKTFADLTIMICVLFGVTFGAWYTQSIAGTVLFYFGAQSIATFLLLRVVLRKFDIKDGIKLDKHQSVDILYGKQLTLFQAPAVLLPSLEKATVFLLFGPAALAFFVVATIPMEHARNALRSLFQFYILPHIEKDPKNSHLRHWFFVAAGITLISMIALVFFILAFLPVLFPGYQDAKYLALLLILSLISLPMQVFIISWIAHQFKHKLLKYAYVSVILDIVLFVTLGSLYGLKGAIIAKLIVEFLKIILIRVLHKGHI